jgi:hypothetical protein
MVSQDDTDAIRNAVNDGETCTRACYGSTTKGAIVYFPPGTSPFSIARYSSLFVISLIWAEISREVSHQQKY